MKRIFSGMMFIFALAIFASPAHAAAKNIQLKIDGVVIASDVAAEVRNGHTMVPLRVISENLGAKVTGTNSEIILTKDNIQVKLKLNSGNVTKNGESVVLDAKPYIKNNRTMVPLRFLSETFGCQVDFRNSTVSVNSEALVIDQVAIKALQDEYHMIMGGVVQQIEGNAYTTAIHDTIVKNLGTSIEAPEHYSWLVSIDIPGSYDKERQFDFLDANGKSIKRYDIYTINRSFPEEMLKPYPEGLIHDVTSDQWYLFSKTARRSVFQIMETASKNGFIKIISNTIA